jgi:hypothetical protein
MANTITDAIRELAGTHNSSFSTNVTCLVQSVNIDTRSCVCTPISNHLTGDIINVKLMAEVDDGILLIPVIGSTVIVAHSKRNEPFVAVFSGIQSIFIIAVGSIQFQGGEYGGIVRVGDLVTKLNNLENLVNDFIAKYNVHTHIASGSATSPTVARETTILTPTVRHDIENTSITHGS